jgi:iduronate 2-sulfatase
MRAGNYTSIPQMFKEKGWFTSSFGKVYDLRTSSFNNSKEWICDGPFSWSEPTTFCGADTWQEDIELAAPGSQSHKLLASVNDEAKHSDVRITAASIARLNVSFDALLATGSISPPLHSALSLARSNAQQQKRLPVQPLPSPWFLAVGLHRPHLPLLVPPRHLALYPEGG